MANAGTEATTQLIDDLKARPASEAAKHLGEIDAAPAYAALAALNPAFTQDILAALPSAQRRTIVS